MEKYNKIVLYIFMIQIVASVVRAENSFLQFEGNIYDTPQIYYLFGYNEISNNDKLNLREYILIENIVSFRTKAPDNKGDIIFNFIYHKEDEIENIYSEAMYPEDHYSDTYIFGLHNYKDLYKKGFSLGIYFILRSGSESGMHIPIPIPYLGFNIFRTKRSYFEINLFDTINLMPYSIGYKKQIKNATLNLNLCFLNNDYFSSLLKLHYNLYKNIILMGQYSYSSKYYNNIFRLGIGINDLDLYDN